MPERSDELCCGSLTYKTAVRILGVLTTIGAVANIIWAIVILPGCYSDTCNIGWSVLAGGIIALVAAAMLLIGVKKERHSYLAPYYVLMMVDSCVYMIYSIIFFTESLIGLGFLCMFVSSISLFFGFIVLRYRRHLMLLQVRAAAQNVVPGHVVIIDSAQAPYQIQPGYQAPYQPTPVYQAPYQPQPGYQAPYQPPPAYQPYPQPQPSDLNDQQLPQSTSQAKF